MLGLLSEKKFLAAWDRLTGDLGQRLGELDERLGKLDERLARAERSERLARAALESLAADHEALRDLLGRLHSQAPATEALLSLAENFTVWQLAEGETPETALLAKKLAGLLAEFDLELIAELRVPFDPDRHEACHARFDPDLPENTVLEIVRPGFSVGGRVLRCASVVVNRPETQGDDHV
jgi:molecular chaperone GrpE